MIVQPFIRPLKPGCFVSFKLSAIEQKPSFGDYPSKPTVVLVVGAYDEADKHIDRSLRARSQPLTRR